MDFGDYQRLGKMASTSSIASVTRGLKSLPSKIEQTVKDILLEYAQKIFSEAMAGVPDGMPEIRSSYKLEVSESGLRVTIYTDNEIAAYFEFGTGGFAASYLSGKPEEMSEDAIRFYVNGEGTTPAMPYLFPAYYKYKDQIQPELDKRIQKLLDSI